MPKLRIIGRVFPDNVQIKLVTKGPVETYNQPLDLRCKLSTAFDKNNVIVSCELNQFDSDKHFMALFTLAHDTVRSFLDLMCFAHGHPLMLIFERVEREDGSSGRIMFQDQTIVPYATSVANQQDFAEILSLLYRNPEISLAVRDLADSMSSLYAAPINCARAVEAVRNQFIPDNGTEKQGWKNMREALNISEGFLREITDLSRDPRHGRNRRIMGNPIRASGYGSWQVMNRFFEYKKRNDQPLPLFEFPLLA